jgi:hypothetical protein
MNAKKANEYGGLRRCPVRDPPISTVFSTGVENFGERPNAAWKIACGVDSKQKEADCNTLQRDQIGHVEHAIRKASPHRWRHPQLL